MTANSVVNEGDVPSLRALISLASARGRLLFWTIVAGLVAQVLTLGSLVAGAWLVGQTIAQRPGLIDIPFATTLLLISAGGAAVGRWWQSAVSHDFAFALIEKLQLGIYDGLERAAPAYVLGKRTGELASIATSDAESMENFYAHILGDYVAALLIPAGSIVTLFMVHWSFGFILLLFVLLIISVPWWLAGHADIQSERLSSAIGDLNAVVAENIQGIRELSIFTDRKTQIGRVQEVSSAVAKEQQKFGLRLGIQQAALDGGLALSVFFVTAVAISLSSKGQLPPSLLPVVIALSVGAVLPVLDVTLTARKLNLLKVGAGRIFTILQQAPNIRDSNQGRQNTSYSIDFEKVTFSYSKHRPPALRNVSFKVESGETVALVGSSGAGKSTCTNLLLRFWDPDTGRVRIGGVDLREMSLANLRRLVSVVPQDTHLFNETIWENIRLGRPDASQVEIEKAARIAQAHEFIQLLPNGYETICGEQGAQLSGGQRQRIAIARAILCDTPILVLDEASSHLDVESERALQIALEEIRLNRTVVVIAHRPATIRSVDRVLVFDNGRLVEEGPHCELLQRGGLYSRTHEVLSRLD